MYQKLTIVGNLGSDPELRYTPSGQAVCNFSVATNRRWTGSDGNPQEETCWFRVSTWGKLAEVCNQYLKKGRQVFVEGRMTVDRESGGPRVWQAQDGTWRASYEVTALEVKFLGGRDSGFEGGGGGSGAPASQGPGMTEDEIPF
ncbi:MAG: single-stranded DNA-binding protein [Chloroflexi bacterium]|nr:MAG: single-stranded DNA-binding protein [Chloroflexota bacterium]